uniref:Uncharacterized protein n=1 Tax=Pipistrellus kuhlii TaxID=59472 RepID=A0A7J7ZJD4_PIPKU|nr:hypothetical protein mPipKuh1_009606 [Pipistrellus kuhlii]
MEHRVGTPTCSPLSLQGQPRTGQTIAPLLESARDAQLIWMFSARLFSMISNQMLALCIFFQERLKELTGSLVLEKGHLEKCPEKPHKCTLATNKVTAVSSWTSSPPEAPLSLVFISLKTS